MSRYWDWKVTTHKAVEFGLIFEPQLESLFYCGIRTKEQDHAGFYFYWTAFGQGVEFNVYDVRHASERGATA